MSTIRGLIKHTRRSLRLSSAGMAAMGIKAQPEALDLSVIVDIDYVMGHHDVAVGVDDLTPMPSDERLRLRAEDKSG
jgi:hypothetical protein